jgi:hypothetical protein
MEGLRFEKKGQNCIKRIFGPVFLKKLLTPFCISGLLGFDRLTKKLTMIVLGFEILVTGIKYLVDL